METLTDQELITALQQRFDFNRRALNDLQALTSKLEATNRRLQESEALKSHFLSNIRNEINNPLASIIGLARQLAGGAADAGAAAAVAGLIFAEAFHLDFQMQNIFAAAELEAGEASPEVARIDVACIVDGVISSLRHQAEAKGIRFDCRGEEALPFVTDAGKLSLMLSNLVANAIEFTPAGGEVEVAYVVDDGVLQVSVRDSGPGIDEEMRDAIFDRFRQLDTGSTKNHRGHGLGLSVVGALAQLLGGSIRPEEAADGGALFLLALPAAAAEADVLAPEGNLFLFDQAEIF